MNIKNNQHLVKTKFKNNVFKLFFLYLQKFNYTYHMILNL